MKKNILFAGFFLLFLLEFLWVSALQAGSSQFLWKPKSESDGRLVVLFPSMYRIGKTRTAKVIYSGGADGPTRYDQTGVNGDRIHARFPKSGSAYGSNVRVVLIFKNGGTVSWVIPNGSSRFEKNGHGTVGGSGGIDDVLNNPDSGSKATINLDKGNQGSKSYKLEKDGEIKVSAYLATYGPASLKVTINGKEWMSWQRANDSDGSLLKVDGRDIASSIFEEKPGDPSPKASSHSYKGKEGDVFELTLQGSFGAGDPHLRLFADEAKEEKKDEKEKKD
ncbi:hypothetical protein ACFL35_19015 [Candidatus Riflebacteria bacterium]